MTTRPFITRPTDAGYTGVYVHCDGYPSARLPLLLANCRYRFSGDVEALARYLIDDVLTSAAGWSALGTGLLRSPPEELRHALTGGDEHPSRTLADVTDPGGAPAARRLVTPSTTGGLDWGYVLHPHGIEVINLHAEDPHRGPIVDWRTDPRRPFSDFHQLWKPGRPPAVRTRPASPPVPTTPAGPHPAAGPRTVRHQRHPLESPCPRPTPPRSRSSSPPGRSPTGWTTSPPCTPASPAKACRGKP